MDIVLMIYIYILHDVLYTSMCFTTTIPRVLVAVYKAMQDLYHH